MSFQFTAAHIESPTLPSKENSRTNNAMDRAAHRSRSPARPRSPQRPPGRIAEIHPLARQRTSFTIRTEVNAIGNTTNIAKLIGMELISRAATAEVGIACLDDNDESHNLSNATFNGGGTITKADGTVISSTSVVLRIIM